MSLETLSDLNFYILKLIVISLIAGIVRVFRTLKS